MCLQKSTIIVNAHLCNTGTPDLHSEESDSSSGSALRRSTAEATKTLANEWERIERTLYDEEGEKCSRPQIIEECKQWRALHPQLRCVFFFAYHKTLHTNCEFYGHYSSSPNIILTTLKQGISTLPNSQILLLRIQILWFRRQYNFVVQNYNI